jgi:hypothetical protein
MAKPKKSASPAKKAAKKAPSKKGNDAPPPSPPEDVPEVAGLEADYDALLPLAQGVDLRDAAPRRTDVSLACHNAVKGSHAVLEKKALIAEHLPKVDIAALEVIPRIASALTFASLRVDHLTHPESGVRGKLSRARELRRLLLGSARVLAEAGVLDVKAVKKIEEGSGPIDVADDCVALASLFTAHAAKVKGKSPVTAQQIKEAAALGAELKSVLRPGRASKKVEPTAEMAGAAEVRERFWTLLAQRYDTLWKVGAYLFGKDEVGERVPSLQAFARGRRPGKAPGSEQAPGAPAPEN